jgi:predicted nucleotidyltransferase
MKLTLDTLRERNLILLEAISGSHAYGLNIATSDVDIRGVFILPQTNCMA